MTATRAELQAAMEKFPPRCLYCHAANTLTADLDDLGLASVRRVMTGDEKGEVRDSHEARRKTCTACGRKSDMKRVWEDRMARVKGYLKSRSR